MRFAVYDDYRIGVVDSGASALVDVTTALPTFLDGLPEQRMNWLISNWPQLVGELQSLAESRVGQKLPISSLHLRAPSPAPKHIFALPSNFVSHLTELGPKSVSRGRTARELGFFLKAPGSLVGPSDIISLPPLDRRFDHEAEIAVVIGKTAANVSREQVQDYVFGYTGLVDVTMRIEPGLHEEERSMRKSFRSFTPLGPFILTSDEVGYPAELTTNLSVNGEMRQEGRAQDMIVGVAEAIALISSVVTLEAGDIVAMGTPSGVSAVTSGDALRMEILGFGAMTLSVLSETGR